MKRPAPRRLLLAATLAGLTGLVGLAGCQNPISGVITYGDRYREQGIKRYRADDYLQAKGAFDEAVEQNPSDAANHYWLGESLLALGQPGNALRSLRTGLRVRRLTDENRQAVQLRGDLADATGRAIAASPNGTSELQRLEAEARESQDVDLYLAVASAHRQLGDADNAIDAYDTTLALAPEDGPISKEYGLYLRELGQADLATPVLIRAYDADPEDEEVTAALREVGVVPGPSLRPRSRLSRPPVPKGPLPEFKVQAGFEDNRQKPVDLDAVRERYKEPQ